MMENDRMYEPVHVEMIGVEDGHERFTKDGHTVLPPVAKWRNNLTALSQHENLLFMASDDCVAVYEPEFPFQTLRRQYALLIKPELHNRNVPGYLAARRDGVQDHCINHLVVGDLGSQEVMVLATDSGNVEAYYVSSILEAINRAPGQSLAGNRSDVLGLRPFFSYWVRQSAWGIDIHKEARMIAVSSNTPNEAQPGIDADTSASVTVFAFALSDENTSNSPSDEEEMFFDDDSAEWTDWPANSDAKEPVRDRNYKIRLAGWAGHENNVPNISFVNTSDDSEGTWLLSTDITGAMKLWQIWKGTCFRTWYFGNPDSSVRPWLHHQYPGWNVAAIDITCFRTANNNDEFIGAHKAPKYYGYLDPGQNYNITPIVARLASNGRFHPSHPDRNDDELLSDIDQLHSDHEDDDHDGIDEMEDIQTAADSEHSTPDVHSRDLEQFNRPTEYDIETDLQSEYNYSTESDPESGQSGSNSPQSPPQPNTRMQRHIRRQVTPIQNPNIKIPEIAMVHCSDSHIRLLGSPRARFPHIFSANVLRQVMSPTVHTHMQGLEFAHMERLNMLHNIPELGVLLVATQTGRVAVCALTRQPRGLLGLRVDWVLPTRRQEKQGRRPELCPLVGMAVSPVQGRANSTPSDHDSDSSNFPSTHPIEIDGINTSFDDQVVVLRHKARPQERNAWTSKTGTPPEPTIETKPWKQLVETEEWKAVEVSRRYRLMLTYSDLSVLTYEISRGVEKREMP